MSLPDLLTLAGAITLTVVAKYAPSLVQSCLTRRLVRGAGWTETLEDINALRTNERTGIIATLSKVTR